MRLEQLHLKELIRSPTLSQSLGKLWLLFVTWDILNYVDAHCNALTHWNNMDTSGEGIIQAEVYYYWTGLTFEAASSWHSCSYFTGLSCFISASAPSLCFVLILVAQCSACSCSWIHSKFLVTWKRAGVADRMIGPRIRTYCNVCWLWKWSYVKGRSVLVLIMGQTYYKINFFLSILSDILQSLLIQKFINNIRLVHTVVL